MLGGLQLGDELATLVQRVRDRGIPADDGLDRTVAENGRKRLAGRALLARRRTRVRRAHAVNGPSMRLAHIKRACAEKRKKKHEKKRRK